LSGQTDNNYRIFLACLQLSGDVFFQIIQRTSTLQVSRFFFSIERKKSDYSGRFIELPFPFVAQQYI